jgi:hypothetical protein
MSDTLLCRFDSESDEFLPAVVRNMTDENVEVTHPNTGEAVVFQSSENQDIHPAELNVVVDVIPEGKRINISCPVLAPNTESATENAFIQGLIVQKKYKPLRIRVEFANGSYAWLDRDKIRVKQSPWTRLDTNSGTTEQRMKRKSFEEDSPQECAKKYKKGEIVRLPHGVLKKVWTYLGSPYFRRVYLPMSIFVFC